MIRTEPIDHETERLAAIERERQAMARLLRDVFKPAPAPRAVKKRRKVCGTK